eukprot:gene24596-33064_t
MENELLISISRGDSLRKKNLDGVHPTYELLLRITRKRDSSKATTAKQLSQQQDVKNDSLVVTKFFNQYRQLSTDLLKCKIEERVATELRTQFPPSFKSSMLGVKMSEDALRQRCVMLDQWFRFLMENFSSLPAAAQSLITQFISDDQSHPVIVHLAALTSPTTPTLTSPAEEVGRQGSTSGDLSEARLLELSRPTAVTGTGTGTGSIYTVVVRKGPMLPKRPGETKLHHSYETQISVAAGALGRRGAEVRSTLSVCRVFDGYRTLKRDLEAAGLLTAEPDEENSARVVLLNAWMGQLLRCFSSLTAAAQEILLQFLLPEEDRQSELRGALRSLLRGDPDPAVTANPPTPPGSRTASVDGSEAAEVRERPLSAALGTLLSGELLAALAQPTLINQFASVLVTKSDAAVQKNDCSGSSSGSGSGRLHIAYTATLRIVSVGELEPDLLANLDEGRYDSATGSGTVFVSVSLAFSAYRELSRQLEGCRVFCMDNEALRDGEPGDMIIDAAFPPTLSKSKLGLALTPAELLRRYKDLPVGAKDLVKSFFHIDPEDPAEPHMQTLVDILDGSFTAPVVLTDLRSSSHRGIMSRKFGIEAPVRRSEDGHSHSNIAELPEQQQQQQQQGRVPVVGSNGGSSFPLQSDILPPPPFRTASSNYLLYARMVSRQQDLC